ncbi:3-dehydro-L-gulonate 2-dehydrogenase [Sunxiuqinia sp. A32]|uniref:3-dehydro-L-gulonate 2-dehydrogenase n=1 Tax=Sunxiuqinia sp. A32 TaxID=3461496 RepID=UPI004045B7AB
MRVSYTELKIILEQILLKYGFEKSKAAICAEIFATNSLEGIYSHGINRFPRFIRFIKKGYINVDAEPEKYSGVAAIEQWNGNLAPGPLNANFFTNRAIEIADEYGLGCVAARNTNHWMRGGTYGWQAARKGYAFIGWTNTIANMPAWGATQNKLGNNPLVIAIPYKKEAIVLDMALSQFSYGKMENLSLTNKHLPIPGGFDEKGKLTTDPKEILKTGRVIPTGYWKGAGLSLLLDMLGAILSAGLSISEVTSQNKDDYGISQVFIVFNLKKLSNFPSIENHLTQIIEDFKQAEKEDSTTELRYPGERAAQIREENLKLGVPVDESIWNEIQSL